MPSGVTHDMEIMHEETFGPVMPVMPFDTVNEAVDLDFGLSDDVFRGDREQGEAAPGGRCHFGQRRQPDGRPGPRRGGKFPPFHRHGRFPHRRRKQAILYQSAEAKGVEAFDELQFCWGAFNGRPNS